MIVPFLIGFIYQESSYIPFLFTFFLSFSIGAAGWKATSQSDKTLQARDGFIVVVLFWVIFSAISTMPFYIDSRLEMSFTDALFEGISGITTTGASVLDNIDNLPKSILYYRRAGLSFVKCVNQRKAQI
ncbi:potassium transporter TrkG [Shewanella fodinae]|uniref:Cation transport protein n=1 Tax=Shewanella fodinae TaxID=552357 RepID=A0A4R2F0V7_9GAMM|nr:potassium transporter TrkG [Shewanella fodinae]TCN75124.1 cation transport protein [Shewanella fodinae]